MNAPLPAKEEGKSDAEHVMSQLAWMRHLPANWDSYGAKMIDRGAIQKAQALASKLVGPWDACPIHDGSVQLEQHADGYDIEIVISNAGTRVTP